MNTSLEGKVALITGSSRGIGKAVALALAAEGARVAVHYRAHEAEGRSVVSEIEESGGQALAIQADLTYSDQVERLFHQIDQSFGGLDVLVLNAGQVGRGEIHKLDEDQWLAILDVNLNAAFRCARLAVPRLIARGGGNIVTISSNAGKKGGRATGAHYAASKGGLIATAFTLAIQLAPYNIRVNDVAPAEILTDMLSQRSAESIENTRMRIPLRRMGTPADVAQAVVFLVSDAAAFITGISLDVDGGLRLV